jgi:hypothetical protein
VVLWGTGNVFRLLDEQIAATLMRTQSAATTKDLFRRHRQHLRKPGAGHTREPWSMRRYGS